MQNVKKHTTSIIRIQITVHSRTRLDSRRHSIRPIYLATNLHVESASERIGDGHALAAGGGGDGLGFVAAGGYVCAAAGVFEVVGEHEVGLGVGWGGEEGEEGEGDGEEVVEGEWGHWGGWVVGSELERMQSDGCEMKSGFVSWSSRIEGMASKNWTKCAKA